MSEEQQTRDGDTDDGDDDGCGVVDTDSRVQEAMRRAQGITEVTIDLLPTDIQENQVVTDFVSAGCGCTKANGRQCSEQFSLEYLKSVRESCAELSRSELDLVIMGQLLACTNQSSSVVTSSRNPEAERQRSYTTLFHQSKPVCAKTFGMLHGVGRTRFKNLLKSLKKYGLTPRTHGNAKKKPHHALSLSSIEYVVRFIHNYEQNALLLPGRVPGYSRTDIQLLPSSTSKRQIWRVYQSAADEVEDNSVQKVAYSTFCTLWRQLVPSVVLMKPMSDLCWTCQQNSPAILRAANHIESEKSASIKAAEEHLTIVQLERSFYRSSCDDCRTLVRSHFIKDGCFAPPSPFSSISTGPVKVHYSFDYAQQVHFPSDPMQPGPIYFLTPRKCTIFGVNCEAIPRQINFLTDEAGDCGKGANAVISRLHYFFDNLSLRERVALLHADNCTGQNKNNAMMHYLLWRTMTNRHDDITLSFLVVGHTKFSPDWCFGLVKRLYRRTRVGSLKGIAEVVNKSAECNVAQLVSREDGSTIVPTYQWTDFFTPHFKKIPGIKKYHHFRMSSSTPGAVFVKEHADSPEKRFDLLKDSWSPIAHELPSTVTPLGLSAERQWYLYDQIRPFCPDADKDITCPLPSVPKPGRGTTPAPEERPIDASSPPKRPRTCGTCRREGHNSRTCPNK